MPFISYLCLSPRVSSPSPSITLFIVILSFSRLSGVWQWGRWPPFSVEEVGTDALVSILPVCDLSSEKCGNFSHVNDGILTWNQKTRNMSHGDIWISGLHYSKSSVFETRLVVLLLLTSDLSCPSPDEWVGLCAPTKWKFIWATSWWCCVNSLRLYGIFQIPHPNIAATLRSDDSFLEMSKHRTE